MTLNVGQAYHGETTTMMRSYRLRNWAAMAICLVLVGCSDSKARRRVAAMDTETLGRLSTEYPADSKAGRFIAEELSRRPPKTILEPQDKPNPVPTSPIPPTRAVPLPAYEIVKHDRYDVPIKTQIAMHVVVSGDITEAGLRNLLQKLYGDASGIRDFQHHGGRPTHIFIYVYTSREYFDSGMGQWIAMLSKIGEGSTIDTEVRTKLIAQLSAQPEIRDGLPESKRKEIFRARVMAEDRADAEAQRLYPIPDPLDPEYSHTEAGAQVMKQAEAINTLGRQYRADLSAQHGITEQQLQAISVEALEKNWPMP